MDIVITSVGGREFLLSKSEVEKMMKKRGGRSLFIIDIGVPRNVDPDAGKLESVYLYNIDDLSSIANENKDQRKKSSETAEGILREDVEKLCAWLDTLELVPTIVRLRESFEEKRRLELERFFQKNPSISDRDRKEIERLTKDLNSKLLHDPSVNLKKVEEAVDRYDYARMLNEIFALKDRADDE